jgi:uncharacterized protein (TIGR02453 family)
MAFTGFPTAAVEFYEGLAADNSRAFWLANKAVYEQSVKTPMEALLADLDEFGPFKVFRPYNDVRFAKNKPPYKENIGAYGESEGGAGFYVGFDAGGLFVGSGYYAMQSDQLERFRAGVLGDATGAELAALVSAVEQRGLRPGAISELKTAPRGIPKDHPRIELLRRKGLMAGRRFEMAPWMHTKKVVAKVRDTWNAAAPLNEWLDLHVGPSTLAPFEFGADR